jgi:hypothetical protein
MQQRSVQATTSLREVLGLSDTKILSTALAEVAAEEARHNPDFAQRIRETYAELEQLNTSRATRSRKPATLHSELIPLRSIEGLRFDPHAPVDPYMLQTIYGDAQLRRALEGYSLARLKEAAALVEERNPGTKPTSRARKDTIIDYIVECVAGPSY